MFIAISLLSSVIQAQVASNWFEDSLNVGKFDEFVVFNSLETFGGAEILCENNDGTLARISSQEEFAVAASFIKTESAGAVWIGLRREPDAPQLDPTSFVFVDGVQNSVFYETRGTFPWNNNEPNNNVAEGQECVQFFRNVLLWDDFQCTSTKRVLCRRDCSTIIEEEPEVDVITSKEELNFITLVECGLIFILFVFLCLVLKVKTKQLKEVERDLLGLRYLE